MGRVKIGILMKSGFAFLILLASLATIRADEAIANAQQTLKDQGFYYGQVTGEKDNVTTDAIRRYQIRNGLQVTGELNDETIRSLHSSNAASAQSATPKASSSNADTSDLRADSSSRETTAPNSAPVQPFVPPQNRQTTVPNPGAFGPPANGLFAGTPYENAPPEVQRKIIVRTQKLLARRGLFKREIDGAYGPDLAFSLRAYQSRVGLTPTGRFDLETLAALELLPGARVPVFTPRRGPRGEPIEEPPVRGEWIRP
jgi:peptidoglycan hydrolase-like protein with peptidoglycan-binding domain